MCPHPRTCELGHFLKYCAPQRNGPEHSVSTQLSGSLPAFSHFLFLSDTEPREGEKKRCRTSKSFTLFKIASISDSVVNPLGLTEQPVFMGSDVLILYLDNTQHHSSFSLHTSPNIPFFLSRSFVKLTYPSYLYSTLHKT